MAEITSVTAIAWDTYSGEAYQGHSTVQFKAKFNSYLRSYTLKVGDEVVATGNYGILAFLATSTCHYLKTDKFSNKYFPIITFTGTFGPLFGEKKTETVTIDPKVFIRPYSPPTVAKGLVFRSNADGSVNDEGKYITANLNFKIASLYGKTNKIENITVYTKIRTGESKDFSVVKVLSPGTNMFTFGGNYSTECGYDVRIDYEDSVGVKDVYVDYVTTGLVAISLHHNSAAAFGKSVERFDGLELAEKWNLYTHENVYHDKDVYIGGNIHIVGKIIQETEKPEYVPNPDYKAIREIVSGTAEMFELLQLEEGEVGTIDFFLGINVGNAWQEINQTVTIGKMDGNLFCTFSNKESEGLFDYIIKENEQGCCVKLLEPSKEGSLTLYRITSFTKTEGSGVLKLFGKTY